MNKKRSNVENYILDLAEQFDQFGGSNVDRYKKMFMSMDDDQFDKFMHALRDGNTQLSIILPNNSNISTNSVIDLAKTRDISLFEKVFLHDPHTKRRYKTKYPMMIITIPVRRLSQYLFNKISLPDGDQHINPVTGQVIPPDKGAAFSAIETQVLASKGLETSIVELIKIRSGDMNAYRSMKYTIEEQGDVSIKDIPLMGRPRSAITAQKYFHAMLIDSTL